MSYEGRIQQLCIPCNYYEEQNCYADTKTCPICNRKWSKSNRVDDTNGEADGFDPSMVIEYGDGYTMKKELEQTRIQLTLAKQLISTLIIGLKKIAYDDPQGIGMGRALAAQNILKDIQPDWLEIFGDLTELKR